MYLLIICYESHNFKNYNYDPQIIYIIFALLCRKKISKSIFLGQTLELVLLSGIRMFSTILVLFFSNDNNNMNKNKFILPLELWRKPNLWVFIFLPIKKNNINIITQRIGISNVQFNIIISFYFNVEML